MAAVFMGVPAPQIGQYRGSREPFAGWVVTGGQPRPAPAFSIVQPAGNSWALALWAAERRGEEEAFAAAPEMLEWTGSDRWKLKVPLRSGTLTVQRTEALLFVQDAEREPVRTPIASARRESTERDEIVAAYQAAAARYSSYRDLTGYRITITWILLTLFAAQELGLFFLRRRLGDHGRAIRLALGTGWLAAGGWLGFVYLNP